MIHHVTAISKSYEENKRFYTQVLGMKYVKENVNQDDVGTYHLYYGDPKASPGSLMTFFIYPDAQKGEVGFGAASGIKLEVPKAKFEELKRSLGEEFEDPDGLKIKIFPGEDYKIIGVMTPGSKKFLEDFDLEADNDFVTFDKPAVMGFGSIHHVAYSAKDDEAQLKQREKLYRTSFNVSPVIDRYYFKSIYFHEPNGCLLEIATDGPGFFIDEKELGSKLCLPPRLEPKRKEIERMLRK